MLVRRCCVQLSELAPMTPGVAGFGVLLKSLVAPGRLRHSALQCAVELSRGSGGSSGCIDRGRNKDLSTAQCRAGDQVGAHG